jgi:hypothetical protein
MGFGGTIEPKIDLRAPKCSGAERRFTNSFMAELVPAIQRTATSVLPFSNRGRQRFAVPISYIH